MRDTRLSTTIKKKELAEKELRKYASRVEVEHFFKTYEISETNYSERINYLKLAMGEIAIYYSMDKKESNSFTPAIDSNLYQDELNFFLDGEWRLFLKD